jgi:hypothetical protein
MQKLVFQNFARLGNIAGLQATHADSLRLPSHLTFLTDFLFPPQLATTRGRIPSTSSGLQDTSTPDSGRFHFNILSYIEPELTHGLEHRPKTVMEVARRLYRCCLSCKDPFPSPCQQEEFVAAVWSEACGSSLRELRQDERASVVSFVRCGTISRESSVLSSKHDVSHRHEDEDHA